MKRLDENVPPRGRSVSDFEGGGYSLMEKDGSKRGLFIGHLPTRKSVALYANEFTPGVGATGRPLAYFRNEDDAKWALETLQSLVEPLVRAFEEGI